MSRMRIDQDHQIVRKTCVLDGGVFSVARGCNRSLQHPVHLSEVEITEQRRNHSPYTKGNLGRRPKANRRLAASLKEWGYCGES